MKANQLKGGVLLSYLQMGLGMVISMIYTPIMLRLLGQSEYGIYNISASVISYLSLFNMGFGSSYARYYFKYKKENDEKKIASLNGLFISVFTVLGILVLAAGSVLAFNCKLIFDEGLTASELELTKILMLIMTFNMALSFPASVFVSFITVNEKFIFQKLVNMIKTVFSPFVTIVVLLLGFRSIGMTLVVTLFALVTDAINFVFCIKKLKMRFSFRHIEFRLLGEIAVFSVYIALVLVVDEVNWHFGKFILGRFRGSVATAVYSVATTLCTYYRNISTAITNVFTPRIHRIINSDNPSRRITELFTRVGRVQFFLLTLISSGFMFFGRRFIKLWAGAGYEDAYVMAAMFLFAVTIPLIQGLGIEIQRAMNMHRFRAIAYFVMAIINVAISIPLCNWLGGVGCALGTALSLVLANGVVMNIYYYKKMKIDVMYFWKEILRSLKGMIAPFLLGILITGYTQRCPIAVYLALIAAYAAVYCLGVYRFSMNSYEKGLVTSFAKKIRK